MAVKYTKSQQEVIDARNSTLLVAAAAGSGKTAVLTRRIIGLITDKKDPVDIDRILVVTYTTAAASEMRERIGNAIFEALENDPENRHLKRQTSLIHNAKICTIDSFCSFVLREYFSDIGHDPSIRIADKGELKLLGKEVQDDIALSHFKENDGDFIFAVDAMDSSGDEKTLLETVAALCKSADAHPFVLDWLRSAESEDGEAVDAFIIDDIKSVLGSMATVCDKGISICEEPDGPYMYGEAFDNDKKMISKALNCSSTGEIETVISNFSFTKLSGKRDSSVSADKRGAAKECRDFVKKQLKAINDLYFFIPSDIRKEDEKNASKLKKIIIDLACEYYERTMALKKDRKVMDFSDAEHFCLDILLRKKEDGSGYEATESARDLRSFFREIMIDEYQDSNLVQEYILSSIASDEDGRYNRFMVGDIKQSIYRFRQARPELFMEKLSSYKEGEGEPERKIILSKNFRSRAEVTAVVNTVFEKLMIQKIGGVIYDKDAKLYPGAVYPKGEGFDPEMLVLLKDSESDDEKVVQECRMIALKIKEIISTLKVTDEKSGELRPARFGDIAILLRAAKGWAEPLRDVLSEYDIPAHSPSSKGYFAAREVSVCLDFLRITVNPLQDIPLYNVMSSYIGEFTEEDIALIRSCGEKGKSGLYDAIQTFTGKNKEANQKDETVSIRESNKELFDKCCQFTDFLEKYRKRSFYCTVRELLGSLLEETGFLTLMSAFPKGAKRKANLELLLDKAADFEKNGTKGIFSFIRYIEQLKKEDEDFGEASNVDENADVVRILTIHKSKGLEFPVCIVAGLGSRFKKTDSKGMVLWDADMGVACDMIDPNRRIRRRGARKTAIGRKIARDAMGEELRVLYVAMTRAKEKLIMTSILDKEETVISKMSADVNYAGIISAVTFTDLLIPALPKECIKIVNPNELMFDEVMENAEAVAKKEDIFSLRETGAEISPNSRLIKERFYYGYPGKNLEGLFTKTTVSELKIAHMTDENENASNLFENTDPAGDWGVSLSDAYVPSFAGGSQKVTGAMAGSAYHRLMEILDMRELVIETDSEKIRNSLSQRIEDYVSSGKMSREESMLMDMEKIAGFLGSDTALRMAKAMDNGALHREQPFMLGIEASRLNKDFPPSETVLIQGIIDAWWEEEDGIVVLDYKTDRVSRAEKLIDRYRIQLELYADALKQLTHKNIKEMLIYSFYLDKTIKL